MFFISIIIIIIFNFIFFLGGGWLLLFFDVVFVSLVRFGCLVVWECFFGLSWSDFCRNVG